MVFEQSFQSWIPSAVDGTPLASFDVRNDVLPGGGRVGVVEAFGELDLSTADEFGRALRHCGDSHSVIVVDLSGVTFMDCSALRALGALRRDLATRRGQLCVVATRPSVLRLFALTGTRLSLVPDGKQAMAVLERSVHSRIVLG
jgi:anti-sigma B factor antagonist